MSILGEAIGVETIAGPFTVLLKKGTTLPVSYSASFSTSLDDQPEAAISLAAGEPNRPRQLIQLVVDDLPLCPRGIPRLPIKLSVDDSGKVLLEIQHPSTGETLSATANVAVERSTQS
jgi:molecular chaperone DnaK (HSP70)